MAGIIRRRTRSEAVAVASDRPLQELVRDAGRDVQLLLRQEVALAKAELREKATAAARATVAGAGAVVCLHAGALTLIGAVVLGLVALGVAAWLAALGTALVALGAALLLAGRARRAVRAMDGLAPQRTVDMARETVEWARNGGH